MNRAGSTKRFHIKRNGGMWVLLAARSDNPRILTPIQYGRTIGEITSSDTAARLWRLFGISKQTALCEQPIHITMEEWIRAGADYDRARARS
jgi:hypothetical protein